MRRSLGVLGRIALTAAVFLVSSKTESRADGLIPLEFDQNRPLIIATDGSVTYSQSMGDFSVQATGLFFLSNNLPFGNPQVPITDDAAAISLTLNSSGDLIGAGSITVGGSIDFDQDGVNDASGNLLSGTIGAFGAAPAGPAPWEFDGLFRIDGGLLTQPSIPLSGGGTFDDLFHVGELAGFDLVIEQQVSGILGDFLADFSGNTAKGVTVGAVVPEPAPALLGLIALACLSGARLAGLIGRRTRPRPAD